MKDLKIPKDVVDYEAATTEDDANKYLTQREIDDIFAYPDYKIKQHKRADVKRNLKMIQYVIEFQVLNGMRISELLAIQPHNIDFENITLLIDGSIYWDHQPKGSAIRYDEDERLPPLYWIDSKEHQHIEAAMLENKKEASWNDRYMDKGYVFTGSTDSPMPQDQVNDMLKEAADWTGISKKKKVTSHILHHNHISVLAFLDVGIKALMNRVDRSDYRTILQIYTHVTDKMNETMMDKLEKVN
ncbi:tyrosine-type recombinase/integrase [Salinicoccus kekensis]|uniref:tyrosine-type recombinase/integrase n=1 Tax=Salinicoccus kekensis TaxID=714307 RepID=UPI0015C9F61C|nr:tyrosine-type recombinase/integrase [Salinicoccus kekensis]